MRPLQRCCSASVLLLVASLVPLACAEAQSSTAGGLAPFDARLFRAVAAEHSGSNVFLSPLSAYVALAMAYDASGGSTRSAIGRTMGLPAGASSAADRALAARLHALTTDRENVVSIANSLWLQPDVPIDAQYLQRMHAQLDAEVATVDLATPGAVGRINAWASTATHGRIDRMVENPFSDTTIAVMLNAIYFKGSWAQAFDAGNTHPRPFHLPGGVLAQRASMMQRGTFAYARGEGYEALRVPYRGGRYAMYLLLPGRGRRLASLLPLLEPAASQAWIASLRPADVELQLPKFRAEATMDLKAPLQSLGMGIAFDGHAADFSGMLPRWYLARRRACIDAIWQKTFVQVDEQGTEAAAVTALSMVVPTSASPEPIAFTVDRPFVALIREETTGTVLFVGQVVDPR